MTKKLFLTSILAIGFAMPAMADDFPTNGLMQENTTYTNAATETNMDGVYEGTVNAEAQYENAVYQLAAGQYLPANSETPTDCDQEGYFCPGASDVLFNESAPEGLTSCSAATNGAYTLSAGTGSSADSCYRACVTGANGDVPHSSGSLTGGVYYNGTSGDGVNACVPSACENGWHIRSGIEDLNAIIGQNQGENRAYIDNAGTFAQRKYGNGTDHNQAFYGITENKTWAAYYDSTRGMITGQARCSSVGDAYSWAWADGATASSLAIHTTAELGAENGDWCYCNITSYTKGDETYNLSSPWVIYSSYFGSSSDCAKNCSMDCAYGAIAVDYKQRLIFREALLNSVDAMPVSSCGANTITIDWSDVDPATAGRNNEGTVKYGGNINTPYKAVEKRGHTFKGWKFIKTTE